MLWNELQEHREALLALGKKHGITNIRVFGTAARGEDGPASDVDLWVDVAPGCSLVQVTRFKREAHLLLQRPVDVVSDVYWAMRDDVIREARPL